MPACFPADVAGLSSGWQKNKDRNLDFMEKAGFWSNTVLQCHDLECPPGRIYSFGSVSFFDSSEPFLRP